MPPADQAFSALLDDLAERGMLEDTLVLWTGEFGRTPRVGQSVPGGAGAGRDGRDHWSNVFTSVLAGGRTTITALVPLSELENYQSKLKSMTAGEGSYSISFSHYDPVPARTQKELADAYKPAVEAD